MSKDGLIDFLVRHPFFALLFMILSIAVVCLDYVLSCILDFSGFSCPLDRVMFFMMEVVEQVSEEYEKMLKRSEVVV